MITTQQVNFLVDIAKECNLADPIDWGLLKITEDEAYQMMASSVLEQFEHMETEQQRTVMLATMTKMLVENFVLNLKLKGAEKLLKDIDNT